MFKTIKNKLLIGVLVGFLIPYALGTLYIQNYSDNWLMTSSVEQSSLLLGELANRVDEAFIVRMKEQVAMLSLDERVVTGKGNVRNYLSTDGNPNQSSPSKVEKSINDIFISMKSTHEDIGFIFYGLSDGGYIEYPGFKPMEVYDPRTRIWYSSALVNDTVTVSAPYLSAVSEELIVSFTKAVKQNNETIGIIGISVGLDQLKSSINEISIGKSGYIIVLDHNNNIVVNPVNDDWLTVNVKDLLTEETSYLTIGHDEVQNQIVGENEMVIQGYESENTGWRYISVIPIDELLQQSNDLTSILIYVNVIVSLLIAIITILIANRIISPINDIDRAIGKMSDFDFDGTENVVKNYSGQTDEIGTIAKSLGIMKDKIQKHLKKIEDQNKDIKEKNEELITSEEELLSQLNRIDEQQEYIKFLAYHDPLTGLPNRLGFTDMASVNFTDDKPAVVGLLDLDNFKIINDTLGHIYGDKVLKVIGQRLLRLEDEDVVVSRFGGDEFLIMRQQECSEEAIQDFTDIITSVFEDAIIIEGNHLNIEFSTGFSIYPHDSKDINTLIMNADMALYSVKESQKGSYAVYHKSMNQRLVAKTEIEKILKDALLNDGFKVLYQPLVDLETGSINSFEALLRLNGNEYGPDQFIPVAEETGLIIDIGRAVVKLVLKNLSDWVNTGHSIIPISINFSPLQVHDATFVEFLLGQLEQSGIEGNMINLEITESVFIENQDKAVELLEHLRSRGIKVSIDDFGTGFSSLSYLTYLPVDCIKLDKSLCERFLDLSSIQVMDSLIQLSHSLDLIVVAEGIEDVEQVRRLVVGKCDMVQGYYFSKALEPEQAFQLIDENYKGRYNKSALEMTSIIEERTDII